jgi:hypothetical protein
METAIATVLVPAVMAMAMSRSIPVAMIAKARTPIAAAVSARAQYASQPREAARQFALRMLRCRPAAQWVAAARAPAQ